MTIKRKQYTINEKLQLLDRFHALSCSNITIAASSIGVSRSLLQSLVKNEVHLRRQSLEMPAAKRFRQRNGTYPELEQALLDWVHVCAGKQIPIDGPLICTKALELAKNVGIDNFTASKGWFYRWVRRNSLKFTLLHGNAADADGESAQLFRNTEWVEIFRKFPTCNIFNADETALYYRALPNSSYAKASESANLRGIKTPKDRVTLLLVCSLEGEKYTPLLIGKSAKPRCLKSIPHLPLTYKNSVNSWMTTKIFNEFLKSWNYEFVCQKRYICLIVDNCTAHKLTKAL